MYPCDEVRPTLVSSHSSAHVAKTPLQSEKTRMDMIHMILLEVCRNKLHQAPIEDESNLRILDLGTGTGIWAIDMAE